MSNYTENSKETPRNRETASNTAAESFDNNPLVTNNISDILASEQTQKISTLKKNEIIHNSDNKVRHRAELIAVLAALKGVEAQAEEIYEYIWKKESGSTDTANLASAIRALGLISQVETKNKISSNILPALAMMEGGRCILVLDKNAENLTIYDSYFADNRTEVDLDLFHSFFTGKLITGRVPLSYLIAKHTPNLDISHWFWGHFKNLSRQIAEIILGSLVANILAVSVALFSLQVYDRVVPHQSYSTLFVLALGALTAIIFEGLLKVVRAQLTDKAGRHIDLSLQHVLMSKIVGMRSDVKPMPPSNLFAAMREFASVRDFFTSSTISTLADIPFILVFLLLATSIAGSIVWVIILGGILMLLPAYFLQRRIIILTRQTLGANTKASRLLHEAIFELDTLKTQRVEDRFLRTWNDLNTLSSHSVIEQRKLSSALIHWSQAVQQATYVCAVVFGSMKVFSGEFTVGTIIATGILTSRTLAPLTQFAGTIARWSNVKTALDGLETIIKSSQDMDANMSYLRRKSLKGKFDLNHVLFRYRADSPATLDLTDITILPGQRVAILGANGSGKSTLLKLLSGLYEPQVGSIKVDGCDIRQIHRRDLRSCVGYLGQDVRLFTGTLRSNLNADKLEYEDSRLFDALDFAGLGDFVRSNHKGLDLEIGDGLGDLSIGQRQSIGWARIWLQNPDIVLLDEPTAALDASLERAVVARFDSWLGKRTAIIATHRVPILSITNRAIVLQHGRLVLDGPCDQVLNHLSPETEK